MTVQEQAERAQVEFRPLKMEMKLANTTEQIDGNIVRTLRSEYIPFNGYLDRERGTVSIIGSGPSLKDTWRSIKGDIIACNASVQFLLDRGIVPKYMMCFDADVLVKEFFDRTHPAITYLLASRVHPVAFEALRENKVVVWHAAGDLNIQTLLEQHRKMEPMIGGGSAAVTRTFFLAHALGYRTLHVHGIDSSYTVGHTHFRQSTTEEKRMPIAVGREKRIFHTTPWMAQQAEDFKALIPQMQQALGVRFVIHGDGLIPYLARQMGVDNDTETGARHWWRDVKATAKTLWRHI